MGIDTFIFEVMQETAASLGKSFDVYWPADEQGKNDPPERNLSIHFCHILLSKGFFVYAEADHPNKRDQKIQGIDILAISPDMSCCFACEFKAYTGNSMIKSIYDLERVTSFNLNNKFTSKVIGQERIDTVRKCSNKFGIVAGLLWRPGVTSPDISKNSRQLEFENKIIELGGITAKPIMVRTHQVEGVFRGSYYLYHALLGNVAHTTSW